MYKTKAAQVFVNKYRFVKILYTYFIGQGLLQMINLLNGFYIIRWLDFENQAKFTLALGMFSTISFFSDLGFGGTLLSLVGSDIDNKEVVGKYISGIRYYKNKLIVLSILVSSVVATVFYTRQNWGFEFICVYIFILIGALCQSSMGYYAAVIQAKGELRAYYKPQIIVSILRFSISYLMVKVFTLDVIVAVALISLGSLYSTYSLKQYARKYYSEITPITDVVKSEIIKTIAPIVPMSILFIIQGQVGMFLIGYYANYKTIAEVGALSRLGQFFSLLTPFTSIVLLPYFAKSTVSTIATRSIITVVISLLITLPFIVVAYTTPKFYLIVLGDKFKQLDYLVGMFFVSVSINYISGIVWAIIFARKLSRWHFSIVSIIATVFVQTVCIINIPLSTTQGIILFTLWTYLTSLVLNLIICTIGIFKLSNQLKIV